MGPLAPRLALIALFSCSAASAQVETASPVEGAAVGNPAAPPPISLLAVPMNAVPAAPIPFAAAPTVSASPAAAPRLAPALAEPAALPAAAAAAAIETSPEVRRISERAAEPGESEELSAAAPGRAFFDAAGPEKDGAGIWTKIKAWTGLGDRVPPWPGASGEKVRLGGRPFVLGSLLVDGGSSREWRSQTGDYVVKILNPRIAAPPDGGEVRLLRESAAAGIPIARLVAASADGRVMAKELIEGADAAALLQKGFSPHLQEGWAELAAKLIRAGLTANLAPENLRWQHWSSRWTLLEPGGVAAGSSDKVIAQLLTPAARRAGVEAGVFLAAVRGRLGPDSAAWSQTLAALRASPRFAPDLAALAAYDRALPKPPAVVFAPASEPAPFPDEVGPPSIATKALGYDPLTTGFHRALHADDPGKTNTRVFAVEPEGKDPAAVKIAQWSIIRNELALRRVIRRWFGRYFDAPAALGVKAGSSSYLVMEFKPGSRAEASNPLTREQRAALAVLVHAFGISDMNPGNVLFPPRGLPVLIDFEVALNRSTPNASRIGDEGIALEMPWVSRFEPNRAEDYQPAVRAWRALLAEPGSAAALLADFRAAGFSADEASGLLETVKENTADLDWTIQNDVDFVNQFAAAKRLAGRR